MLYTSYRRCCVLYLLRGHQICNKLYVMVVYHSCVNIYSMAVDGKRNRDRPKLKWRDLVNEEMAGNQMITRWQKTENIGMT